MNDRLQEIRARLDAATPGPWSNADEWNRVDASVIPDTKYMEPYTATVAIVGQPPSADFIANAPADIAWLLDRVAEIEEHNRAMSADLATQ